MDYVFKCLSIRDMEYEYKKYITENRSEIRKVREGCVPVVIEYKDGKRFLFMPIDYYDRKYKNGRRKGIDYMTV